MTSVLAVFFYIYAFNEPDEAGCWIGTIAGKTVVAPQEEYTLAGATIKLEDAVDWGHKMTLWFKMGFFIYAIQTGFILIRMIGQCAGVKALA